VRVRSANGYGEGTRSMRKCVYRKRHDLETLVCTRGPNFPISRLSRASRILFVGLGVSRWCLSRRRIVRSLADDEAPRR
jgi:hypothetical protein